MAKPGYFAWYEWRYAVGRYKGRVARDPKLRPKGLPKIIPPTWWVRALKQRHVPKPKPAPRRFPYIMYDSVTLSAIPATAKAVAGYVGGKWPTYTTLLKMFPKAKHLSIAVSASEDAQCLDVEKGDASPGQAAAWIKRQHARGIKCPVVYTSLAYAQGLVDLLSKADLQYGMDYKLWTAHYTNQRHICSPSKCGLGLKVKAHATQFTSSALGRNLDASYCSSDFL